ncbi:NPCBM/NEW2 domain-containing protein [Actinosynnema sp. CS-041913]|uniref:NPCBM/NEW2 domain-containing protein n=1 Tax=Actinosynnema sp. CS-041913 TaxID=3239917 RepID=UPI003D90FF4C
MDGRHHRARTSADHPESEPTTSKTTIALARWAGAATSLAGALIAILTFPTTVLKIVGAAVCVIIGATVLATSRDRDRPSTALLAGLSTASVATLVLAIVLGSMDMSPRATPANAASTPPPSTTSTPSETIGTAQSVPLTPPNAVSLADLKPIENEANENLWTTGATRLQGVPHDKAIAVTGAWCGATQVEFALNARFERFTAFIGIADDSAETKPLDFYVLADGNPADFPAVGKTSRMVDIPVAGAQRLTIGVRPPTGDASKCPGPERVGVWADPLLTPAK